MPQVRLASRAVLAVDGSDWRSFLQGLLTNDVERLAPGALRFAALLTPQGRVLHDLFVLAGADGCRLDVRAAGRDDLLRRLTLYRLRAKVTLALTDEVVEAAWGEQPGAGWAADPRLPALGWRRVVPISEALADEAAYDAHRLALGAPGPADWGMERTYPIEANFDRLHGIDFHKGCFVGQETTSRMHRRGQVKTRMLPLTFDGPPPPPGAEVLTVEERRAGEVLSGGDGRAMAALRLDRIDGPLTVDGRAVQVNWPDWQPREAVESAA